MAFALPTISRTDFHLSSQCTACVQRLGNLYKLKTTLPCLSAPHSSGCQLPSQDPLSSPLVSPFSRPVVSHLVVFSEHALCRATCFFQSSSPSLHATSLFESLSPPLGASLLRALFQWPSPPPTHSSLSSSKWAVCLRNRSPGPSQPVSLEPVSFHPLFCHRLQVLHKCPTFFFGPPP